MTDLLTAPERCTGESRQVLLGAIDIAHAPDRLVSMLGSCVALVLFDPFAGLAGMAHVMLPESRGEGTESPGRYADTAVPALIEELISHGARRSAIQAHLIGGASLPGVPGASDLGPANVRALCAALAVRGIPIGYREVGGVTARKAQFEIATGRVTVFTFSGAHAPGVLS